jgi:hypothetical protein
MSFLTRWFNRKMVAAIGLLGIIQVGGFVAFVAGYEAITVAVVMVTSFLLVIIALIALRKVKSIADALHGKRMRLMMREALVNDGSGGGAFGEDRAEYITRRILAAFEHERRATQVRFEQILQEKVDVDN